MKNDSHTQAMAQQTTETTEKEPEEITTALTPFQSLIHSIKDLLTRDQFPDGSPRTHVRGLPLFCFAIVYWNAFIIYATLHRSTYQWLIYLAVQGIAFLLISLTHWWPTQDQTTLDVLNWLQFISCPLSIAVTAGLGVTNDICYTLLIWSALMCIPPLHHALCKEVFLTPMDERLKPDQAFTFPAQILPAAYSIMTAPNTQRYKFLTASVTLAIVLIGGFQGYHLLWFTGTVLTITVCLLSPPFQQVMQMPKMPWHRESWWNTQDDYHLLILIIQIYWIGITRRI